MAIDGVIVIYHNLGGINRGDDPSYPFKATAELGTPGLGVVGRMTAYGSEKMAIRAKTKELLDHALSLVGVRVGAHLHDRLVSLVITGPGKDGPDTVLERFGTPD